MKITIEGDAKEIAPFRGDYSTARIEDGEKTGNGANDGVDNEKVGAIRAVRADDGQVAVWDGN